MRRASQSTAVACLTAMLTIPANVTGALGAGLLDGDVNIVNYYPNLSTPYESVHGSGPTTSVITLNGSGYHFEFTANTIVFTNPYSNNWCLPCGWVWWVRSDFSGIPAISDVLNDSTSTLAPPSLTFNSDTIWMKYPSGGPRSDGAFTTLDVSFASGVVPEPSTWAMMLAGFTFLGFAGYRARRSAVAAL